MEELYNSILNQTKTELCDVFLMKGTRLEGYVYHGAEYVLVAGEKGCQLIKHEAIASIQIRGANLGLTKHG